LLHKRALGDMKRLDTNFDRYRPVVDTNAWRQRNEPGSGLFFDLGPHMLDQSLRAFGSPTAINASIRREREAAQVDDAFDVALEYANGLRVTLGASMLACVPRPRFSAHGTAGSWIKYQLDPQEAALKRGDRPPSTTWGQEPDTAHGILTRCHGDISASETVKTLPGNYLAYYENVRDAINGAAPLAVTAEQALQVMELLELGMKSHSEHRSVPVKFSTI
jgi:scyllo-inositol 2-dehydrogenase (NADP+)